MVVKDKNVLVFGSGISGEAACELLLKEDLYKRQVYGIRARFSAVA